MSLKSQAIKGFGWTVFENVLSQGTVFIVYIILARLLMPEDFGVIALIMSIVSISNTLADGGLGSALIQKEDVTKEDYNSVFVSNVTISGFIYLILVIFAKPISKFFEQPDLPQLLYVTGSILLIQSLSGIQLTRMDKELDFKTASVIASIATILSGIIAVTMAYSGFEIWSLVAFVVSEPLLETILVLVRYKWRPSFEFSKKSFKELFSFGYKLLFAELLSSLYTNIYYFLIGYFFKPKTLGYYTKAQQFQAPLSGYITGAISNISFPILSKVQGDNKRLKSVFSKFLKFTVFINFTILIALAGMAEPVVILLIGEKWQTSVFYLQLLCIPGMFYPLQILNLDILVVKGVSDVYLKIEIVKKIILIPLVVITAFFSIEIMLYGLIVFSVTEYFINSSYSKKLIGYSIREQLKDIFPYLLMAALVFAAIYASSFLISSDTENYLYKQVAVQLLSGLVTFFAINELIDFEEYREIKTRIWSFFVKEKEKE